MKKNRDKEKYIVRNKISLFYRIRDLFLTLFLWGLWFYMLYPLIALILWKYFDINIFYNYSEEDIKTLGNSLKTMLIRSSIVITFLVLSFVGWGYYNKKRFSPRKNRRCQIPNPVSSKMMANSLQIDSKAIEVSKEARYIQIYHTDKSPISKENIFKSIDDLQVKSVNLYFGDDWDEIRDKSGFAYTHIPKKSTARTFQLKKVK